jgi:hypothetical protein
MVSQMESAGTNWIKTKEKFVRAKKFASGNFSLVERSREATFFLYRYHLLRQQDVAKWMPTKEKGRFARKNSLVENRH